MADPLADRGLSLGAQVSSVDGGERQMRRSTVCSRNEELKFFTVVRNLVTEVPVHVPGAREETSVALLQTETVAGDSTDTRSTAARRTPAVESPALTSERGARQACGRSGRRPVRPRRLLPLQSPGRPGGGGSASRRRPTKRPGQGRRRVCSQPGRA